MWIVYTYFQTFLSHWEMLLSKKLREQNLRLRLVVRFTVALNVKILLYAL
jgi:hypothetical protein